MLTAKDSTIESLNKPEKGSLRHLGTKSQKQPMKTKLKKLREKMKNQSGRLQERATMMQRPKILLMNLRMSLI